MNAWARSVGCWLRALWIAARQPTLVLAVGRLGTLCSSRVYDAVSYAVDKVADDPSFHPTKDHELKRTQAIEWTQHWAREASLRPSAWEVSFLIEFVVGLRKDRL